MHGRFCCFLFFIFSVTKHAPYNQVPATDGVDGTTFVPVEPVRWEVTPDTLATLSARCRPRLPVHAGFGGAAPPASEKEKEDCLSSVGNGCGGASFAGSLAPPGYEMSTALRCYRYLPGTASLPHYDKSASVEEGPSHPPLFSAYTVVFYLNGDDYDGGATSFFQPIITGGSDGGDGDGDGGNGGGGGSSRRGLTWAVGGGSAPLYRVVVRVQGQTGDALFFPHGHRGSRAYPNPLHEGSPVVGVTPKYIIRSDLMFVSPAAGKAERKKKVV